MRHRHETQAGADGRQDRAYMFSRLISLLWPVCNVGSWAHACIACIAPTLIFDRGFQLSSHLCDDAETWTSTFSKASPSQPSQLWIPAQPRTQTVLLVPPALGLPPKRAGTAHQRRGTPRPATAAAAAAAAAAKGEVGRRKPCLLGAAGAAGRPLSLLSLGGGDPRSGVGAGAKAEAGAGVETG